MILAVSHLAWAPEEEAEGWALVAQRGIRAGEVAPGRCWPRETLQAWAAEGAGEVPPLEPPVAGDWQWVGFQAILFGCPAWQLFDAQTSPAMARYVGALARLCGREGGRYLVFGAPKNRLRPKGMNEEAALERAVDFFRPVADAAAAAGVFIAFEANPAAYGGNFGLRSAAAQALVRRVDHPGLRWHLDTGELAMNGVAVADVREVLRAGADVLGSVHVSEPFLGDFAEPWPGHAAVAEGLRELGYAGTVSLEMKRPAGGLTRVAKAVDFFCHLYGEA